MESANSKKDGTKLSPISKFKRFFFKELWDMSGDELKGVKGAAVSLLRIVITSVSGIINKRILVQASSLSYATLLAIGPILAITILFSGIFFKDKGEGFIYEKIMEATVFVMPAFNEMSDVYVKDDSPAQKQNAQASNESTEKGESAAQQAQSGERQMKINPKIFEFINNISKGSTSVGVIGIVTMLVTCLLLCINMETAFNYIWGVRKGRRWLDRIVFYFVLIFFGSVGLVFGMTFIATSQLAQFVKWIPFIADYASWITYLLGLLVMTVVLASFYKFIPYTRVKWRSALVGAFVIMILLLLNNKGSFLYVSYIVKQQNFYGYLAIVAVAMFSLYIFWTLILTGGQIAFAVQYVEFLSDDNAWNDMGERSRRLCALAVYAEICRVFYKGDAHAPHIGNLVQKLKLPKTVIAACVDLLSLKNFICAAEDNDIDGYYFKPAISPDSVSIAGFFEKLSTNDGDAQIVERLETDSSAIATAMASLKCFAKSVDASKTIREIL